MYTTKIFHVIIKAICVQKFINQTSQKKGISVHLANLTKIQACNSFL